MERTLQCSLELELEYGIGHSPEFTSSRESIRYVECRKQTILRSLDYP